MRARFVPILFCLLLAMAGVGAQAADKSITLDTGDTFTISWGADWVVGVNPPNSPAGTLSITGSDAKLWRITVGPLPPHPTLTGDAGNLRMYVRMMARGMEDSGIEVNPEHKSIEGRNARGFYLKVHDGRKKTPAQIRKAGGLFTDAYLGALSIGDRPYLFEVSWIQGGESAANAALAAVKTIRIR
jgi:hypothetical protein